MQLKKRYSIVLSLIIGVTPVEIAIPQTKLRSPDRQVRSMTPLPTRLRSPDGKRTAYVSSRPEDDWLTIWLLHKGKARDLLPGDTLGSPGVRAVWLGTWLDNQTVAFQYHCGTGYVCIYKINVNSRSLKEIWIGEVDGAVHWSPRRDRAMIDGHSAELIMFYVDGQTVALPRCPVVPSKHISYAYAFEKWRHNGTQAQVRKLSCDQFDIIISEGYSKIRGEPMIWDGKRLRHWH